MKLALPLRVVALCALAFALACDDTSVDPPSDRGGSGWRQISGGVGESSFRAVFATAQDSVIAFGLDHPVQRFDGHSWEMDPLSGSFGISACWGTSQRNVFAAALNGTLIHFNGSQWTFLPSGFSADLTDVWGLSANDVLVSGIDADTQLGHVYRYNGAWAPFAGRFDVALRTVWASSIRNVIVGGDDGTLTRYDGRALTPLRPTGDGIAWRDSWGFGASTFVVGDNGECVVYAASQLSSLPTPVSSTLYAVCGFNEADMWAAGAGGTLIHYDGSAWHHVPSGTDADLHALAGYDGKLIAVGDHGTVLEFDGASWQIRYDGRGSVFRDMIGFSSGDVYAAGRSATGGGIVQHIDGREWTWPVDEINAIWGATPDDLYAAGINGAVYHYGGDDWVRMITNSTATLFGAHGSVSETGQCVYAVGTRGTIRHWDGERWSPMIPPGWYFSDLRDVWSSRPGFAVAVGPNGTVLRLSGESELHWNPEETGAAHGFTAIAGTGDDDVIAVTSEGQAWHYDGVAWKQLPINTGEVFRDVTMGIWNAAAIVAASTHLTLRRQGDFETIQIPFSGNLNTTWTSHRSTFVAGAQGTILEYSWSP